MDKSKRRIRRLNDRKYKNHIKYLSDIKYGCYIAPAYYYTGKPRNSRNDKNCYYKRIYRGSRSSYLKKVSNKTIRRNKDIEIKSGNFYRKLFDYWYELI